MLNDLRYAVRMLLHAKGWTAVVVVSLALGIGANTAIFSAINGLLLRKIPVSDPDSLVRLRWAGRNQMATSTSDYGSTRQDPATGTNMRTTFSYPMYQQFVKDNQTMSDLFACAPARSRQRRRQRAGGDCAPAFVSTGNYYRVLGVNARLGRVIMPDDDRPDAPPVAVISDKYWRVTVRQRPERRRQGRHGQQRAGHDCRRAAGGVHRRAAAHRRGARHLVSASHWIRS